MENRTLRMIAMAHDMNKKVLVSFFILLFYLFTKQVHTKVRHGMRLPSHNNDIFIGVHLCLACCVPSSAYVLVLSQDRHSELYATI